MFAFMLRLFASPAPFSLIGLDHEVLDWLGKSMNVNVPAKCITSHVYHAGCGLGVVPIILRLSALFTSPLKPNCSLMSWVSSISISFSIIAPAEYKNTIN